MKLKFALIYVAQILVNVSFRDLNFHYQWLQILNTLVTFFTRKKKKYFIKVEFHQ